METEVINTGLHTYGANGGSSSALLVAAQKAAMASTSLCCISGDEGVVGGVGQHTPAAGKLVRMPRRQVDSSIGAPTLMKDVRNGNLFRDSIEVQHVVFVNFVHGPSTDKRS
jgi:hypothetical protein